jgi:SAM-dependent methyltransferase
MSCLVCGGTELRLRFVQRSYPVYRCESCGLEFVAPIPSTAELAEYYDRSYAVPLEMYAAATARNVARIADLERFCPERGHLLELGASYGHGLALARDRGWKVTGVELSPTASEHARTHFGLTVYTRDISEVPLPDGSFDAIVMWHVLEHVRNPKDQLVRLGALLKPGGVLGLRVPNIASFGARVAAQWWPWMCPPAHLWFFSSTTLPTLLEACGYDVLEVKTRRGDGNNVYQYALMATGNALNGVRLLLRPRRSRSPQLARDGAGPAGGAPPAPTPKASVPMSSVPTGAPSGLMQKWLEVLERAQPVTNALNRATRHIIEPIESRGWGDELLVYARRRV